MMLAISPFTSSPVALRSPRTRRHCLCKSAHEPIPNYNYNAEDGKRTQKATLEHVFVKLQGEPVNEGFSGGITYQISERNLVWNDDLKVRLIKRIASAELGVSDEEMEWRLAQLANLLPGLVPRLLRAPPQLVARAAAHCPDIAKRLLHLKIAFPSADLVTMLGNRLTLLLDDDMEAVTTASKTLREMLPGMNVDAFVSDHPLVLDIDMFKAAMEDCRRLMPQHDPVQLLRSNPQMVLSLVKGKGLIEYDQVANPWS